MTKLLTRPSHNCSFPSSPTLHIPPQSIHSLHLARLHRRTCLTTRPQSPARVTGRILHNLAAEWALRLARVVLGGDVAAVVAVEDGPVGAAVCALTGAAAIGGRVAAVESGVVVSFRRVDYGEGHEGLRADIGGWGWGGGGGR